MQLISLLITFSTFQIPLGGSYTLSVPSQLLLALVLLAILEMVVPQYLQKLMHPVVSLSMDLGTCSLLTRVIMLSVRLLLALALSQQWLALVLRVIAEMADLHYWQQ